jgi:hypothetical protein
MCSEFDILTKPHPWTDADWREYFRVRGREDRRRGYVCAVADNLARADVELVLLLAEFEQVWKTTDIAKEMRRELVAEIR